MMPELRTSKYRQFSTVLWKNLLLQTRSRGCCGLGGWTGFLLNIILPAGIVFFLFCMIQIVELPSLVRQAASYSPFQLESVQWFDPQHSPDIFAAGKNNSAQLLFSPSSRDVRQVAELFIKDAACGTSKSASNHFSRQYFAPPDGLWRVCSDYSHCVKDPRCWSPVLNNSVTFADSEDAAIGLIRDRPGIFDALIVFDESASLSSYKLRLNQSTLVDPRWLQDRKLKTQWEGPWGHTEFMDYWWFSNLQHAVDKAVLAFQHGSEQPLNISLSIKPYPDAQVSLDITGAAMTAVVQLTLIIAYMIPFRFAITSVVHEKELQLGEGLYIMGLSHAMYWASWACSHYIVVASSGTLVAVVMLGMFQRSTFFINLIFFWLLAAALVPYTYCISTLFKNTKQATYWSMLIYGISLAPAQLATALNPYGGLSWYWACLSPPSALLLYTMSMSVLEMDGLPLTWGTLSNPIAFGHSFSMASVFLVLAFGALLYPVLVWYLDKVMPSSPQRQHPLFFLHPMYWRHREQDRALSGQKHREGEEQGLLEQARRAGAHRLAARVVNLVKSFPATGGGRTLAVDELSLELQDGCITALLGHNGAGKSTTIHILTGLLSPTSGTAYIHGLDIRSDMEAIRQSMGICPQFDVLWPNLSVREHLQMYAGIKGFSPQDASYEAERAAASVDLVSKLDTWAGELSGGQRRKLSVAIAFMGSPRIVFLDEPTSGMDAFTRRFTWDLIRQHRSNAAIVLTTHSMEEADLLSDQIIIMSSGRLVAQGSPLQLKNHYGVGYTLTMSMDDARTADLEGIQQLVGRHVAGSGGLVVAGAEVSVKLPTLQAPSFPGLLRDLQSYKQALGVGAYGLSMTTMEEVFLSVTLGAHPALQEQRAEAADPQATSVSNGHQFDTRLPISPPSGPPSHAYASFVAQFFALLTRRAHSARRSLLQLIFSQLLFPQSFLIILLYVLRPERNFQTTWPPVPINHKYCLGNYPTGMVFNLPTIFDSHTQALQHCFQQSTLLPAHNDSALDAFLLRPMKHGRHVNDVLLLDRPPPAPQVLLNGTLGMEVVIAFNNSLVVGVPGALNAIARALQCYLRTEEREGQQESQGNFRKRVLLSSIPPPLPAAAAQAAATAIAARREAKQDGKNAARTPMATGREGQHSGENGTAASIDSPAPVTTTPELTEDKTDMPTTVASTEMGTTHSATTFSGTPRPSPSPLPPPISVLNAPLPNVIPQDDDTQQVLSLSNIILLTCAVALFAAHTTSMCITYLLQETSSGSRHMLLISGANPAVMLLSNYFWDLLQLLCTAGIGLGVIAGARVAQLSGRYLEAAAVELLVFCAGGLALVYALQYVITDEARAMGRMYQLFFLFPLSAAFTKWSLDIFQIHVPWKSWGIILNLLITGSKIVFPHYHLLLGVTRIMYAYNSFIPSSLSHIAFHMLLPYPSASSQQPVDRSPPPDYLPQSAASYNSAAYGGTPSVAYSSDVLKVPFPSASVSMGMDSPFSPHQDPFSYTAFKQPLIWMLSQAMAYLALALIIEMDVLRFVRAKWQQVRAGDVDSSTRLLSSRSVDEDVAAEEERVRSGGATNSRVLLNGVHKSYWLGLCSFPVHAVRGLWVGVERGACFGLLGLNGAGKTTTFKMLTGETLPNSGDVTVGGASVVKQPAAVRRQLGYAAQGGGLPRGLTGREVLCLFARLRGVPTRELPSAVSFLVSCLGLDKYADRMWESYSGGNKKKLAVAVALVGAPPVVLLDEPSTGMDPAARRFMWTVLQNQVLASGSTVVLTSHSMEECDTLCTRIAIMAEGQLGCLGSSQHLKYRFGMGYRLEVHVQHEEAVQKVVEYVHSSFPAAHKEVEGTRVVCSIPREGLDLPGLFEAVQQHQEEWEVVDYSISQTTLEQVFLALARSIQPGIGREA